MCAGDEMACTATSLVILPERGLNMPQHVTAALHCAHGAMVSQHQVIGQRCWMNAPQSLEHAVTLVQVGSIGVITAGFGLHKVLEKYEIERRVFTAGVLMPWPCRMTHLDVPQIWPKARFHVQKSPWLTG